ncbi:MAG: hypothetical protein ACLGPM_02625 [Acidobacteriota bacterium]
MSYYQNVLKSLQARNGESVASLHVGDARVGFAFSTKDRVDFTTSTLASIDTEGGFDLIWVDGSVTPEGRKMPYQVKLRHAQLVEIHSDIRGGPDRAICFSLKRLLDLGYDYCGLIENDMIFEPGWYSTLLGLFARTAADGVRCGAATVRGFRSRALEYRRGYFLCWNVGAGMVLFSRRAAQLLLDQYQTLAGMTARRVWRFYAETFGVDLGGIWDMWCEAPDRPLGMDWGYSPLLYRHGFASVGSIPSMTCDLEFDVELLLRTQYVTADQDNAGTVWPRVSAARILQKRIEDPFFKIGWFGLNRMPHLRNRIAAAHKARTSAGKPAIKLIRS